MVKVISGKPAPPPRPPSAHSAHTPPPIPPPPSRGMGEPSSSPSPSSTSGLSTDVNGQSPPALSTATATQTHEDTHSGGLGPVSDSGESSGGFVDGGTLNSRPRKSLGNGPVGSGDSEGPNNNAIGKSRPQVPFIAPPSTIGNSAGPKIPSNSPGPADVNAIGGPSESHETATPAQGAATPPAVAPRPHRHHRNHKHKRNSGNDFFHQSQSFLLSVQVCHSS